MTTSAYSPDEHQLLCSPAALDEIVAAMHGGPLPAAPELIECGAIHDGKFDPGLGMPLAGILTAEHEGTVRVTGPAADLTHRYWAASGVQTWWVDGGEGVGRLAALPVELWAHTVVDVTAYGARRVPGDTEPDIPERFAWTELDASAGPDAIRAAVATLAARSEQRHFAEALEQGLWLVWSTAGDAAPALTVLNTPFAAYARRADDDWSVLGGRELWLTLAAWRPWHRRAASTRPFGAQAGKE